MFQSVQKIKKLDWPNFTAEPDVEFSGFSKDINIVSMDWEPAAILNVKHDALPTQCIPYLLIFAILAKMEVFRLVHQGIEA